MSDSPNAQHAHMVLYVKTIDVPRCIKCPTCDAPLRIATEWFDCPNCDTTIQSTPVQFLTSSERNWVTTGFYRPADRVFQEVVIQGLHDLKINCEQTKIYLGL
jgi:hypothetical protein